MCSRRRRGSIVKSDRAWIGEFHCCRCFVKTLLPKANSIYITSCSKSNKITSKEDWKIRANLSTTWFLFIYLYLRILISVIREIAGISDLCLLQQVSFSAWLHERLCRNDNRSQNIQRTQVKQKKNPEIFWEFNLPQCQSPKTRIILARIPDFHISNRNNQWMLYQQI